MRAPSMRAVLHVAGNDVRLFLRDRGTVFWSFVGPILFIGFFGLMFRAPGPPSPTHMHIQNLDTGQTLAQSMTLLLQDAGIVVHPVAPDSVLPADRFGLVIPPGSADTLAAGRPPHLRFLTPNESPTPREQTLRAQVLRAVMSSYLGLARATPTPLSTPRRCASGCASSRGCTSRSAPSPCHPPRRASSARCPPTWSCSSS